jgi:hypothetical protein
MNEPERSWLADTRARLAQRRGEKPATKASQVRALWPEIEAALQGEQSMKSIRKMAGGGRRNQTRPHQPDVIH